MGKENIQIDPRSVCWEKTLIKIFFSGKLTEISIGFIRKSRNTIY